MANVAGLWEQLKNSRGAFPFSRNAYYVGSNALNIPGAKKVASITALQAIMVSGDVAYIGPGTYDESALVTFTSAQSKITLIGVGGRRNAIIKPSTAGQSGIVIHGDDVTLVNLAIGAGSVASSSYALTVTGARFVARDCKFYGGVTQVIVGPGTSALITAGTKGTGADALFDNCSFVDGTNGIVITATDYGAVANLRVINSYFARLTAASFEESGGTASARFTNLIIDSCIFERAADGTAPTKWISLNDDNANTGVASRNVMPSALNSGKNLMSTTLLWVGNFHPAGLSTTQPS